MIQRIKVSPINSLLFIEDLNGGVAPEPVWGAKVLSTSSCISFACFPEQDGPTEVTIGPRSEVVPEALLVFDGVLETPSRTIVITAIDRGRVLRASVERAATRVRIWFSHPDWPDKVAIGLD